MTPFSYADDRRGRSLLRATCAVAVHGEPGNHEKAKCQGSGGSQVVLGVERGTLEEGPAETAQSGGGRGGVGGERKRT